MRWFDKLERKFGNIAIKGLMGYIVGLNAFVYLLTNFLDTTGTYTAKLMLIPELVLRGEVWRLFTYIFIPPEASWVFILFVLYFYYMVGNGLEREWGSFRFNIYYFIGMVGTTIAAFLTGGGTTAVYLNLSLFLAFARIYPDFQLLIFFILPVKMKYLAWLNWAFIAYTVVFEPVPFKVAALVSIINYFVFFGKDIVTRTNTGRQVYYNRKRFNANLPKMAYIHKCKICGITEKDNPQMDFRYCADCEGNHEYCMKHLETHEHVK